MRIGYTQTLMQKDINVNIQAYLIIYTPMIEHMYIYTCKNTCICTKHVYTFMYEYMHLRV